MVLLHAFDPVALATAPADTNRAVLSGLTTADLSTGVVPTYSVKYVLRGTERYTIAGQRHVVRRGEYLLVSGGQSLHFEVESSRPVWGLCLHFTKDYLQDLLRCSSRSDAWLLENPDGPVQPPAMGNQLHRGAGSPLGRLLQQVAYRIDQRQHWIDWDADQFYFQLGMGLIGREGKAPSGEPGGAVRSELRARLMRARQQLLDESCIRSGIPSLAMEAGLSHAHFFRAFCREFGTTPHQYRLQQRLQAAAGLLHSKGLTLSEIAERCGFADLPAFSKAFRKRYGLSPGRFRSDRG